MPAVTVGLATLTMLALALVLGTALGWAHRYFFVPVDPRETAIDDALPGANCGGCGYVGCREYAAAVAGEEAPVNLCTVGGPSCAEAVAAIMGVEVEESWPYRPVIHCNATFEHRLHRRDYKGERTCAAANLVAGVQGCTYGCLGFGDCVVVCDYDAIHMQDGIPVIDYDKCTGCGACVRACPRHIISQVPFKTDRMLVVACSNEDFGTDVRDVCEVGCIGCKACSRVNDLMTMKANLPILDYEKYSPAEADFEQALDKCPQESLVFVGKPSERDLAAVAEEEAPSVVRAEFETTVDQTEWRG